MCVLCVLCVLCVFVLRSVTALCVHLYEAKSVSEERGVAVIRVIRVLGTVCHLHSSLCLFGLQLVASSYKPTQQQPNTISQSKSFF